ncbi:MAG: class I SAM-dependent methyltransferase [Candidatus Bathyarchaeota archaeon]
MSLAPYVPTPNEVVRAMLQVAELKSGETLYDLGCGDGRIVLMAAQEFGAKAVGVELDEDRYNDCRKKVQDLHLENRVNIIRGDFLSIDLREADVVTLYLLTGSNEKIRPNLEHYLKNGVRVVSHDFEMPGWKPVKVQDIKESESYSYSHTLYLYKIQRK